VAIGGQSQLPFQNTSISASDSQTKSLDNMLPFSRLLTFVFGSKLRFVSSLSPVSQTLLQAEAAVTAAKSSTPGVEGDVYLPF